MASFAASVAQIVNKTEENIRYVAMMAIQDVMEAAQTPQVGITKGATSFEVGKIPVAEGELRGSLWAELMGGTSAVGPESYAVALAGYEIGMNMRFEWTAPHALRMELGFTGPDSLGREYQQSGRYFVGTNAARFSEFVANRVQEVNAL